MYKYYRSNSTPTQKTKVRKKKSKHKSDICNITVIYNDFNLLANSGTKLRYSEFYTCSLCVQEGILTIATRAFSRVVYEWNLR